MTKKNKKELDKLKRVWYPMNIGTRVHKDAKHPTRQALKREVSKNVYYL